MINLKELFHSSASDFVLNVDLRKEWFDSLDVWSGQTLAYKRIAWLKSHGVPLHLAENKVYNDVAAMFGKVIRGSQLSSSDWDLSSCGVGVLVDSGARISDDWIPDCLFDHEPVKDLNCHDFDQVDKEEHEGEEENEVSEDSSDEDGGSSDEPDGDSPDMNGDQDVISPDIPSPVGGTEQSNSFNVGGAQKESVLGKSNVFESIQDPKMGSGFENRGGDTRINYAEESGKFFFSLFFQVRLQLG
ncbi:hypothetical protein Hanom_Chr14g01269401 [Helianthus anomalus]